MYAMKQAYDGLSNSHNLLFGCLCVGRTENHDEMDVNVLRY